MTTTFCDLTFIVVVSSHSSSLPCYLFNCAIYWSKSISNSAVSLWENLTADVDNSLPTA